MNRRKAKIATVANHNPIYKYELDFDKIKTVEDVASILKTLKFSFTEEACKDMKHLVKPIAPKDGI